MIPLYYYWVYYVSILRVYSPMMFLVMMCFANCWAMLTKGVCVNLKRSVTYCCILTYTNAFEEMFQIYKFICVVDNLSIFVCRLWSVRQRQLSLSLQFQSLTFSTTRAAAQCTLLVWPATAQTLQWPLPQPVPGTATSTMQSRTQVCVCVSLYSQSVCRGFSFILTHI